MGKILVIKGADFSTVSVEKVKLVADKYDINVVANNSDYGTTTGTGNYTEGTTITITAVANSGYKFSQWDDGDTNATRTITVTNDKTYTAKFTLRSNTPITFTKLNGTALVSNDSAKFGELGTLYPYVGFGIFAFNVYEGDVITLTNVTPNVSSIRWGFFENSFDELIIGTSIAYKYGNLGSIPNSLPYTFTATKNGCFLLTPSLPPSGENYIFDAYIC